MFQASCITNAKSTQCTLVYVMFTFEYCGAFRGWRTSFESGQGSTTFREDLVLKTAAHQTVGTPKTTWGDSDSRIGWTCKVMPVAGSWHFRRIRKTKPTSGGQVQCFVWKSFASGFSLREGIRRLNCNLDINR